ncbi:hypothetical protein C8F04DRAFT_1149944 [Mycena alexandri]|uniref:Tyr recombinase domain-containing protein n=1 Tax=Mycena alexandri TaxID=1745969 RepID=A0AAD6S0X1_9AGAR|nr:hypothetical protein C8F04DRAFT_1149944 [Mycena alexandri]
MGAVSAAVTLTVPVVAPPRPDPRRVVSPLDPAKTENLLRQLGLYESYRHIVVGLREGFDVGIRGLLPRTYLFRQSQILFCRPYLHFFLHRWRTGRWPLLRGLYSSRAGGNNRPIPHITAWASAQTALREIAYGTGHVLSSKRPGDCFHKRGGELRRLSNSMGHIRQHCCFNLIASAWLCRSYFRHFCGLPLNTSATGPTARALCVLGWTRLRGSCSNVRPLLERWRIRFHSRYAGSNLRESWFWPNQEVGGRFLGDSVSRSDVDRGRIYGVDRGHRCTMESGQDKDVRRNTALHWFRLGFTFAIGIPSHREAHCYPRAASPLATYWQSFLSSRCIQLAWKARPRLLHLPPYPAFSQVHLRICQLFPFTARSPEPPSWTDSRLVLGGVHCTQAAEYNAASPARHHGLGMVGRREYVVRHWDRCCGPMGSLALGGWCSCRTQMPVRHRMGRGCRRRAGLTRGGFIGTTGPGGILFPGSLGQCRCCRGDEQGTFEEPRDKQDSEAHLCHPSFSAGSGEIRICSEQGEHLRRTFAGGHHGLFGGFPSSIRSCLPRAPTPPHESTCVVVMPVIAPAPAASMGLLSQQRSGRGLFDLNPSPLRPRCLADERIFQWRGVNVPPRATIDDPIIHFLASTASHASLRDTGGYGSGLRKFHLFCDIFSVPEVSRLPASFEVLHSFALWAATDPAIVAPAVLGGTPFEPVSTDTVGKYLSAVRAWHIAQGWQPPLSEADLDRINWSLRGLRNLQGESRKQPVRPPITLAMLRAMRLVLNLDDPFDACVWAMACCAFWGMMRFDVFFGFDLDDNPYARLDLPSAKTALAGEIQSVFVVPQGDLCPLDALRNLARVVPAAPMDPLFSWRDRRGEIRPMVKTAALQRINAILGAWGWGTAFGHSFRIGGASFYLAKGVTPEIVRLAGRWKSLAYEAYIRAFEQIASRYMAGLA